MPSAPITSFVPQTYAAGVEIDSSISTEGLDLATLVMLVSLKRHEQLEGGVVEQMKNIQDKNAVLAKYRDIINKIKSLNLKDKNGEYIDLSKNQELWKELKTFFDANPQLKAEGFDVIAEKYDIKSGEDYKVRQVVRISADGALEKTTNSIQTEVEKLSGNSQVEMIKLQSTMTKANQMMDFASSFVHKADEVQKGIIRNVG